MVLISLAPADCLASSMVDGMETGQKMAMSDRVTPGRDPGSRCDASVPFAKLQALGNDFVFLSQHHLRASAAGRDLLDNFAEKGALLARRLCDRHFGIGADGLILVAESDNALCQLSWSYFNADGSAAMMCGNGLRCLALYAVDNQLVDSGQFSISTGIGPVPVVFESPERITTDLGQPILESALIPVAGEPRSQVLKESLTIGGLSFSVTCVSMGNPHCVVFESGLKESDFRVLAPRMQELSFFPQGVNVEFVDIVDRSHARVFVWERGCGPTLACASGAAATLVAGVLEGRLERSAVIELPGGNLKVTWLSDKGHVLISGPASCSYKGVLDLGAFLPTEKRA